MDHSLVLAKAYCHSQDAGFKDCRSQAAGLSVEVSVMHKIVTKLSRVCVSIVHFDLEVSSCAILGISEGFAADHVCVMR